MQGNVVSAVFRRNFRSYFINPIGYLFVIAFVLLCVYFAICHEDQFFANNLAELGQLNERFWLLLMLIVPAITMSIWAEERRSGTEELLLTLPASDAEIVLGKYLACLAIYTVALFFSLCIPIVIWTLGSPDWGMIFSAYVGYWFAGAALIAAGMAASLLTSNVTVAFILGMLACAPFAAGHYLLSFAPGKGFLHDNIEKIGVKTHFEPFGDGQITLPSLFYFSAIIAVMLYINMILLSRRHWAGSEGASQRWLHFAVRSVSLLTAAVAIAVLAARAEAFLPFLKWDVTKERIHTLSPYTKQILDKISPDRPVYIEAFISPEVPKELVDVRKNLIALLRQLDSLGGSKVEIRIRDTLPFSPDARDAERVYEIRPESLTNMENGQIRQQDVFLGVACKSGLNEKTIPFFYKGLPIEYELTRLIRTVSLEEVEKKRIGVLTTDAGLFGQFNMQTFQPGRDWMIVQELKQQYTVEQVSPDTSIDAKIDCLIVPMASSLTQTQLNNVIDYVKAGRPTLIVDDPFPSFNPQLAALERKQSPNRNPMFGGAPPPGEKGNLRALTNLLNMEFDARNVIWQDWNPHPQFVEIPPEFVFVGNRKTKTDAINPDSKISSGLQEIVLLYPGSVRGKGGDGPKFIPLLSTASAESGTVVWDKLIDEGPFGMRMMSRNPPRRLDGREFVLAAFITGPFAESALKESEPFDKEKKDEKKDAKKESPKEARVVFLADLDGISDGIFELRRRGDEKLQFDNTTFVLNCVDMLLGDETFIDLRKKRPLRRHLDQLEQMTQDYDKKARADEEEAERQAAKALDDARKELNTEADKIRAQEGLDKRSKAQLLSNAEETANQKLEVRRAEIEAERKQKVRQIQADRLENIRGVQGKVKGLALLLCWVPVAVLGLGVFLSLRSRENEGANANRLV